MKTTQEKTLPRSLTGRRGEGEAAIPVGDGRSIPDIDVFYPGFPGCAGIPRGHEYLLNLA